MKPVIVFALVFYCFTFISCTKERQLPGAVLSLRFENHNQDVEWLQVLGSRSTQSNSFYITADGFDKERFHLELEKVKVVGVVQYLTAKNISYSDGYHFKTGSLQSVEIRIIEITDQRIYGSFKATFINSLSNTDIIRANGEFSIFGGE